MFADKLNKLMTATATTNNRLAKALCVDTSLISRWRTGNRVPSKKADYNGAISRYFAEYSQVKCQVALLCEIMGLSYDPKYTRAYIEEALKMWLEDSSEQKTSLIDGILFKISGYSPAILQGGAEAKPAALPARGRKAARYAGLQGMQDAALDFLTIVADLQKPVTLLLFSDEKMDWMKGESFILQWKALIRRVIARGHRIKIVHNVTRNLSEMLLGVEQWLPLYMTGNIESYYFPGYRESTFAHSWFVAPGACALSTINVGGENETIDCSLETSPERVRHAESLMKVFLGQCLQLIRIYPLSGFGAPDMKDMNLVADRPIVFKTGSLSLVTMPHGLFTQMMHRTPIDEKIKQALIDRHRMEGERLLRSLQGASYTELISLPDRASIISGNVSAQNGMRYSPLDYAEHLENMAELLQKYASFNLRFLPGDSIDLELLAQSGTCGLVVKNGDPQVSFVFNHEHMTEAFYKYLQDKAEDATGPKSRMAAIETLSGFAESIRVAVKEGYCSEERK